MFYKVTFLTDSGFCRQTWLQMSVKVLNLVVFIWTVFQDNLMLNTAGQVLGHRDLVWRLCAMARICLTNILSA